jgi:hypothetical protein
MGFRIFTWLYNEKAGPRAPEGNCIYLFVQKLLFILLSFPPRYR